MSEEILINGKKITELSDMFFEYCELQKENEELKNRNANLRLNLATYDLPEVKKVLTDWRTGELDKKLKKLQKENEELREEIYATRNNRLKMYESFETECNKYKQALEEIREMILGFDNTPIEFKTLNIPLKEEDLKTNEGKFFDFYTKLKDKINEALNDRN